MEELSPKSSWKNFRLVIRVISRWNAYWIPYSG